VLPFHAWKTHPLPPAAILPAECTVHLWRASLSAEPDERQRLWQTLASDEQARAERFLFAEHRERFTVARGMLREVLARYLGLRPGEVRFRYGPHGRPELLGATSPLRFNLSHSGDAALLAICTAHDIGVDIEQVRPDFASLEVARRFFSRLEVQALQALDEEVRCDAFFRCWTRKEAYIKARGEGLFMALDSFDVSLEPGAPAELLATRRDDDDPALWSMAAVDAGAGYTAALCVACSPLRLQGFDWNGLAGA
jgi:4'-phosphopantetheinyl transferase